MEIAAPDLKAVTGLESVIKVVERAADLAAHVAGVIEFATANPQVGREAADAIVYAAMVLRDIREPLGEGLESLRADAAALRATGRQRWTEGWEAHRREAARADRADRAALRAEQAADRAEQAMRAGPPLRVVSG